MFRVKDTSTIREARIARVAADDPQFAVVLSIAHVEWTLRRAIVALGSSPNTELRGRLLACHGLDAYRNLWRDEVLPITRMRLPQVVQNWDGLIRAFRLRHVLIHGVRSCAPDHALRRVEWALAAARDIHTFCGAHGFDLDSRVPVRRQKRQPASSHAPVT